MSRSSTPAAPERDQQLLSIGHQCSAPTCNLVDFLPFKCQHCSQRYCGEHFLPKAHNCDKYDESKHNRVAPSCPMCSTPVAIPPGEDPNIRMERHITHECPVTTGKPSKAKSAPTCDRASCGKVLFAPIKCSKCTKQFCPQHRFPNTHNCPSIKTASGSQTSLGGSSTTSRTPTRPAAAGAAAMAAFKRSMASASSSTSSQAQTTRTSASSPAKAATSSIPNPFSKTDRSPAVAAASSLNLSINTNSTTTTNSTNDDDNDTSHDPPQRCSPKLLNKSVFDYSSFTPPPVFVSA